MAFNDVFSDALIRHNISLLRFDAKLRRQILGQLRTMQESIVAQLANVDFSNLATRVRLESLLEQTNAVIKGTYRGINKHMLGEMNDLAGLEQSFQATKLNNLFGVDIISASLTPAMLRGAVKSNTMFGAPATEWWGRQSANMRKRFGDNMRQGFLLGESTGDLVRRVRGSATGARRLIEVAGRTKSVAVFSGGIMDVTTREAEALVRTSVQSIANRIRLDTYLANTDVISSVQAQVTLDSRTSDICQAHGNIPDEWTIPDFEPVGGSNNFTGPPPWHFNCRSSLVSVTKSWEDLQKQGTGAKATRSQRSIARKLDNNAPKRVRQSMNGLVPRSTSYGKWLRGQPKSIQLEVLGPGKRELFIKGKLNLTQTIDQTGRPLTLHQISKLPQNKPLPLKLPPRQPLPTPVRRLRPPTKLKAPKPEEFLPPPPGIITVAANDLRTLAVGDQYKFNGEVFKVIKKTRTGLESVKWSTRTGKFVTARNRTKITFGTSTPPAPPLPPGLTKVHAGDSATLATLKKGDVFVKDGKIWRIDRKAGTTIQAAEWDGARQKWITARMRIFKTDSPTVGPTVGPTTTTAGAPKATFVPTTNYRSLKVGDLFKDAQGDVWKVHKAGTRSIRVLPWSVKSNRFLSARNGKTFGFTGEAAKTVKQFTKGTANSRATLDKLFDEDGRYMAKGRSFTAFQKRTLLDAKKRMAENGFNKVLGDMMIKRDLQAHIFNIGGFRLKGLGPFGNPYPGQLPSGAYWSRVQGLGMVSEGSSLARMAGTWTHEFGHHMDFSLFRFSARILRGKKLSAGAAKALAEVNKAYQAMLTEYRNASKVVGKRMGLRLKKGIMSEGQEQNNSWAIQRHMKDVSQSSYSMHNEKEWFAETFSQYFNWGGSRAMMARIQPASFNFYETLFSTEMEILWRELG